MTPSELMKAMADAGAPFDAILIAMTALDAKDTEIAARRASDRDRKRKQRGTVTGQSRDTDGTVTDETLSPQSPPKVFPGPLSNTPPIPPKPTNDLARGSRLLDGWQPKSLTGKAAEMVDRWQSGAIERELAKFRNYWLARPGKDACRSDWQRTWINWLISADERKPSNGRQQHHPDLGKSGLAFAMQGNLSDDRPM